MREIKFRAWDSSKNEMFEWKYLLNNPEVLRSVLGNECYAMNPPKSLFIAMQYTGLRDKNGIEIYEGDIVKTALFGQTVGSISFHKGKYVLFFSRGCSPSTEFWGNISDLSMEVIGNIYENLALLGNEMGE